MHSFYFHFHLNCWAVVVAALIQWVIGILWYGVFFKKRWRTLVGFKEGEETKGRILAMVSSFVMSLILCFALANVLLMLRAAPHFMAGFSIGVVFWLGFIAPPLLVEHTFERRRANLYMINTVYWLVAMAVSGGVLAVWR